MAIEERRVRAGAVTLAIRDHAGTTPPVIALHGLASNARWWDLVAARLPRRVIAADLRGHGLSDKPDRGYDFETVTDDVLRLADSLATGPYVVAGHSWGASVALSVAAADPDRCLGCVCVDGGATNLRAYFGDSWEEAEVRMRPPQFSGLTEEAVRTWMHNSPLAEGSDAETAAQIMLGNFAFSSEDGSLRPRLTLERHMQIARHLFDLESYELMTRVPCPVCFIPAGDGGHPFEPKRDAMDHAQRVLGDRATVTWVKGEHDIPVQRPGEVAAAIEDFVTSLTTG